jgi:aminopeptidase N
MPPQENLTRDEAAVRARLLDVEHYDVTLDLTRGDERFGAEVTVRFAASEVGSSTFLDCTAVEVDEVVLNGRVLPAEAVGPTRIALDDLAAENELTVRATMAYQHEGKGLHFFRDPSDDRVYLHSQAEPFDAHLVFPCFDQPDLKATFAVTVEAPEEWVVVSNGACTDRPEPDAAGRWSFATTPRISTYLVAVVAGGYAEFHDTHGDLPLGLYVRRSLAEHLDTDEILTVTRQGLDWFGEAFGITYPFGKYDQLFVPEFSAGAMENPGCITFSEAYVFRSKVTDASRERRAETILHEMAHMWFGDLVTMRWWDDLWLNESFATFMSVLCQAEATRFTGAWTTFLDAEKAWATYQDQLPSTHPIAADMVDIESVHQNFDGITYAKGASVLRQLVAWVGQDEFLAGCRAYFRDHAWGNADLADFLAALEEASGRELEGWTKEWLQTTGINTITPIVDVADDGTYHEVVLLQGAADEHPTLRRHRMAVGVYDLTDDGLVRRERVELDVLGERTVVEGLAGVRAGDVLLANDDDLTFTKTRLDPASLEVVTEHLSRFVEPLPRALVWAAAWDMTRDGELPARTFVELVRNNIASESEIGVLQRLQQRAVAAAERYWDPANRDTLLAGLAADARAAIDAQVPGSDHQLAWVRHWAAVSRDGEQRDAVAGLLAGEWTIEGLTLDTDLRWHLVTCLARAGVVDEERIAAELERDRTDLGERSAATALAIRPTAEAKEAAWRRLLDDTSLSHTMSRQVWGGLMPLDQREALAGYDDRYFEALEQVWSERSLDWAIEFSEGTFPHTLASPMLLDRTDEYLGRDDLSGPLRRVLSEQRDVLARTVRARAVDTRAG